MNMDAANGSLRLELVERLFQRADLDRNQALSVEELAAFVPTETAGEVQSIVSGRDENGDGQRSVAECAGGILAAQTLQGLMSVQEYRDARRSERQADDLKAVDALFARADVVQLDERAVLVRQLVAEPQPTPAAGPMPASPETKDVAEDGPEDSQEPAAIADVLRDHVRMAEMSDVLIARLIQMLGGAGRSTPEFDHQA